MFNADGSSEKGWHFERSIPLAVIGAFILHAFIGVWIASKYDSRIETIEKEQVAASINTKANTASVQLLSERLSNIEGKLEFLVQSAKTKK